MCQRAIPLSRNYWLLEAFAGWIRSRKMETLHNLVGPHRTAANNWFGTMPLAELEDTVAGYCVDHVIVPWHLVTSLNLRSCARAR